LPKPVEVGRVTPCAPLNRKKATNLQKKRRARSDAPCLLRPLFLLGNRPVTPPPERRTPFRPGGGIRKVHADAVIGAPFLSHHHGRGGKLRPTSSPFHFFQNVTGLLPDRL